MSTPVYIKFTVFSRLLACASGVVAVLALLGYAFGYEAVVTVSAGLPGMSILTACAIALMSVAVVVVSAAGSRMLTTALTFAAAIPALAVLASHLIFGQDFLNPFLGRFLHSPIPDAGRMSGATAIAILLQSGSIHFRGHFPRAADAAAGASLLAAAAALLGYAYGGENLRAIPLFNTMALNTAFALFVLALASVMVEPGVGWSSTIASRGAGGQATRRQLTFLLLPPLAGWFLLRAAEAGQLSVGTAMALLVMVIIIPLALLVLRDGRILTMLEGERQARAALLDTHARELAAKLTEQAVQLEVANAERASSQRMEAIGQLTGGIAHDFNNLLMSVSGNLQLWLRQASEGSHGRRYIDNALSAAGRGAKVTGQLLAFSRAQKLAIRPIPIAPALRAARSLIGEALGPNITFVVETPAEDVWATGDPDQLELALLNLAVNARDAMPAGGLIRVECRTTEVVGQSIDAGAYVAIRVVDTGIGMAPDVVRRAAEPFFTTKERGKGTGLGLAQAFGFAKQCRGDLRIYSTPGEGTVIEILLPRALPGEETSEDFAHSSSTQHSVEPATTQTTVLVVDDDEGVRQVVVGALSAVGFAVHEAADGSTGLALLEEIRPAVAVIDFMMPGLNGAQVAAAAQLRLPGLPIVFISGYADTVALEGISNAVVLKKPFDVSALHRAVASAVETNQPR